MKVTCLLVTSSPSVFQGNVRDKHNKKVKYTLVQALRLCTGCRAHRGSRGIALPFLDHGTRRGWGVSVTPRPFINPGKDPVPIVQEAGWAPGSVWTRAENLDSIGIFDPWTVQLVASRYTDYANRPIETNTIQDSKYVKNTTGYQKIWNTFVLKETNEEKILVACMGNKMLIWYGESGLLKTVCVTFRRRYNKGTKVDHWEDEMAMWRKPRIMEEFKKAVGITE
jgi:hypothetical protein